MEQDTTSCPKERQNKHKNCTRNKSQTQDFCILNPIKKEKEISKITRSEEIILGNGQLFFYSFPSYAFYFSLTQEYKDRKYDGYLPD